MLIVLLCVEQHSAGYRLKVRDRLIEREGGVGEGGTQGGSPFLTIFIFFKFPVVELPVHPLEIQ